MNKVLVRVLLFVIGLPFIVVLATWDWLAYLPLAVAAIVFAGFGAGESAALVRSKGLEINPYLPFALGAVFPALAWLENAGLIKPEHTLTAVAIIIVLVFIRQIFANTEASLQPVLNKVTGSLFTLIYPGFFIYFILKIH